MCDRAVLVLSETDYRWAHNFAEAWEIFGRENVVVDGGYPVEDDARIGKWCLCPMDMQATADKINADVKQEDGMDFFFTPRTNPTTEPR